MALASGVWGRGLVISTRCSRSAAGSIASLCPYGRASVDFADRCTPAWWQWLRSGALVASRYRANLRPASPWRTASCMHSAAMADKKALQVLQRPAFQFLGDLFARNGFEIRLVGGAVRDLIIGREPKDYDFCTPSRPDNSLRILKEAGVHVIETGLKHGTITAVIDKEQYEITTLRVDTNQDGRWADVEFTDDWRRDAERRDLTINAMMLSLDGTIHDYFHGLEDARTHCVRFVGDPAQRIQEDYLRIMRYFRFHGRFAVKARHHPGVLEALADNAHGLDIISGERIWMELSKILPLQSSSQLVTTMLETNVLAHIHLAHVDQKHIQELARVVPLTSCPATLLASLISDLDELTTLAEKWHLATAETRLAGFILQHRGHHCSLEEAQDHLVDRVPLTHVLELLLYQASGDIARELQAWVPPRLPVDGRQLRAAGVKPGPQMGDVIKGLMQQWKASRFTLTREELLALLPPQDE